MIDDLGVLERFDFIKQSICQVIKMVPDEPITRYRPENIAVGHGIKLTEESKNPEG
jgi:hypothetical protein